MSSVCVCARVTVLPLSTDKLALPDGGVAGGRAVVPPRHAAVLRAAGAHEGRPGAPRQPGAVRREGYESEGPASMCVA